MGAMVAAVVVGCVLLSAVLRIQRDPWEAQDRLPLAWPVAGVLLVLVASAGRVSHTVGLVAFAIGVVLIWANSLPEPAEEGASSAQQPSGAESAWLTMAFAAAILLGVCTALATEVLVATVIMVAALVALAVVATVGRCRDGQLAIRSAGWLAVILPCLGLGLLGHDRLMLIMQGGRIPQLPGPPPRLHETGGLLLPGLVLLATTAVLAGHGRWRGSWRLAACAGLGLAGVLGAGVMVAGVLG